MYCLIRWGHILAIRWSICWNNLQRRADISLLLLLSLSLSMWLSLLSLCGDDGVKGIFVYSSLELSRRDMFSL